jgi:antitoxin (DNA-binding transcriptional repressor) of toxin-antitoxin stability system
MDASLRELNLNASALARRAQSGETVTITDRGRPIVDMVPHREGLRFADRSDVLRDLRSVGRDEHERFRRQLDAVVDPYFDAAT